MKLGFTGTMSVGKTTLVNELRKLEQFKDYKFFTERSKELKELGIPLNKDSTIKGQTIFMAERATELMNENMITDRTIIDVIAFTIASSHIFSDVKASMINIASYLVKEYDLIIYIPPTLAIEDNGIRETDSEYRKVIDVNIKSLLHDFGVDYYTLKSDEVENRINEIVKVVNNVKNQQLG